MAIASFSGKKEDATVKDPVVEAEKKFDGSLIDNSNILIESLIQYISGSRWTVDYFHAVLGKDDVVTGYDPDMSSAIQQYVTFRDLVLHVTSPLDVQTDPNTTTVQQTGTATYYNTVPPRIGDMFTANLLDHTVGVFKIVEVTRKAFSKKTVYEVEYVLSEIVNGPDHPTIINLVNKVVKTYFYDEDAFKNNMSPLMTSESKQRKTTLNELFYELMTYYFDQMLHPGFRMLILPGQDSVCYDHYVQNFVLSLVSSSDVPAVQDVSRFEPNDTWSGQPTIFTALLERSLRRVRTSARKFGYVTSSLGDGWAVTRSLCYLGIDYTVLPTESALALDGTGELTVKALNTLPNDGYSRTVNASAVPSVPMFTTLDTYVFSEDFYNDTGTLTLLEGEVLKYLKGLAMDGEVLAMLAEDAFGWERVNQYYYIPILALLIRTFTEEFNDAY